MVMTSWADSTEAREGGMEEGAPDLGAVVLRG
jgi:hypothetical protein